MRGLLSPSRGRHHISSFLFAVIIIPHLLLPLLRCLVLLHLPSDCLLLQLVTVDLLQFMDSRRPRL
ncbi:hypothetical protein RchiOBHm_Chr6g0269001 [Rosa chinensis]|uniref:Uncharacterized protein n=1 Tax=Rosa chinensis TaxID=74649 RepID=A0A2P6PQB7_ROSCH|nr:hypothetical protein RchiOBHm_Chr6g0269001 [Rosa chinensis]